MLSKVRLERHTGVRGSAGDRIRLAEVVQRAPQLVGPRLRDYVDEPAGRAAELCVGAARQHHDLLHGVEIEGERRPLAAALLAEERIVEVGAVDRDVVVNALLPGDRQLVAVGSLDDRHLRGEQRQVQVVAPVVRQTGHRGARQARRVLRLRGFDYRRRRLDHHRLELHRRELQCEVDRLAEAQPDARAAGFAEAHAARGHIVRAERHEGGDENAPLVRRKLALEPRLRFAQGDRGSRNRRSRRVGDGAADDTSRGLRLGSEENGERESQYDRPEELAHHASASDALGEGCSGAASVPRQLRDRKKGKELVFSMQNAEIARLLGDVADLLEISAGNPFKVRAYRNAARTVADHPDPVAELVADREFDLTELPGIGDGIAKEITALVQTGTLPQRQQLVATIPPGLLDLLRIPGLGPKRVKLFHDRLKVNSVADLKDALDQGTIAKLGGFGPKLLEKIREGVAGGAAAAQSRIVLHEAEQYARAIVEYLKAGAGGGIDAIDVAGSFRRRKETIGDLDIVVSCANAPAVIERFSKFGDVTQVASQGDTRSTVRLSSGLQVDLRVVEPSCFGAAMQYFTGSQAHNIELRKIAQAKKLKLNEYGVFRGSKCISGRTEEEVYAALGLDWIPPEMRENRGEIALAKQHKLPTLVRLEDIRGDLQMHTDASDGKATLTEMIEAARSLGYAYIAITDHSPRTSMAGQSPAEIRAQWKEIDRLNKGMRGLRVLKSVEMDILESGKLDLPDKLLAEADYVVATIHYGLKQTERQLTDRLLRAIESPWVDAVGHPTGRIMPSRPSYPLDFDVVAKAAAQAGCLLEINGSERLDLPDTLAAAAKSHGVRFVLSTDAHNTRELGFMRFAVAVARRAWLTAVDILNTRPLPEFLKGLRRSRNR